MRKIYTLLLAVIVGASTFAQAPQKMSYQAVIRNSSNQLVVSHAVGMQISILQGSPNGTSVYVETQTPTSNANGLITLEIGSGTADSGIFTSIDWSAGPYFIKTETDPTGGTNYSLTGTSQLLSVPYALYAKTSANGFSGNYNDLANKPSIPDTLKKISLDAGNKLISNVANPLSNYDASNKAYVDASTNIVVSKTGDTLFLGNGQHIIIPGISVANPTPPYLQDADGNVYDTVHIGNQIWMKQNLKTTHYRDGSKIPNVTDGTTWSGLANDAYCWYNNDSITYNNPYGALYNWYAISDNRNVCPTGWHVPTDAEWTTLTDYLGGTSIAGGKLKETGTTHWQTPNTGATNITGFTALPSGYRYLDGAFYGNGGYLDWWSSTEYSAKDAYSRSMSYASNAADRNFDSKEDGFSVRCLHN
jgi:uncharacterized protein (TIGR02145 family)